MPPSLLQSQFETLEEPAPAEEPIVVDVGPPADQIAEEIIRLLGSSATLDRTRS
jgi:gluconate kinase